ncbi:hypothetical protein ACFOOM_12455 [Streptomyces echinoruber]|uniref:Uncharacterized protein n=1 Tax=Streptomyces echinoruber TaxID=68898 RepID=A0A918RK13_9ACTN|nr:hypothetical protein [Streptomyces echinoruber]GHA01023.1 hypothetical protein GCM10010389_45430 [Streptomyces echinoruber]
MSGIKGQPRVDHKHAAQQAREMPGQWVLAGTYGSSVSAKHAANQVRTGERLPAYRPARSFRARTEVTQNGVDLWVCYVAPSDQHTRDFHESITSGLTEDLDAFSRRLEQRGTEPTARPA